MKNSICKNLDIEVSDVDFNFNLNLISIMREFQLLATNHSKDMGLSYEELMRNENAFWVLSKVKVKLSAEMPKFGDNISIITYPKLPGNVKCIRNFKLSDKQNNVRILGTSEWCILDAESRRVRRISSILSYPKDVSHIEEVLETEQFSIIDDAQNTSDEFVYEKVVRATDLDVNMHMNNVVYTKVVIDAFSAEFWKHNSVKEYELHFLNEAPEGSVMRVYRREIEGGFVVVGRDVLTEKSYFRALLKFA